MHFLKKTFFALIGLSVLSFNAQADSVYDVNNAVTNSQGLSIANELITSSILVRYISQVYVKHVALTGTYTLDFSNYLQNLDLNEFSINLTGLSSSNEYLKITLSVEFPNGDCNRGNIISVSGWGSSGIMDTAITQYLSREGEQFLRNIMRHSNLSQYCRN